jgi:hypothetical protein
MDILMQRIRALEERMSRDSQLVKEREEDANQALLARVSSVEEDVERSREEFGQEIKRAFSNSTLAWNSYHQLQRKVEGQEKQIGHVLDRLTDVNASVHRLDDRQLELQDADAYLEERIEHLQETLNETDEPCDRGRNPRPRQQSTSDAPHPDPPFGHPLGAAHRVDSSSVIQRVVPILSGAPSGGREPVQAASAQATSIWTVHISLLPHATVPMPFERNTNAYQRCLSRGLHQVVPIRGRSAEAFCAAVNKAFGSLLKGRPWMPLQAELCNAEQLQGLPMLRQLEPHLIDASYDADFLRKNCAVCDTSGMMESLYITMREPHALSWHAVRRAPIFTEGLEDAWEYDPLLDNDPYDENTVVDDDERPAAGDIVPALPSLKRTASEMQRSSSFGSATGPVAEGVLPRTKRACPAPKATIVDARRPGVGTA